MRVSVVAVGLSSVLACAAGETPVVCEPGGAEGDVEPFAEGVGPTEGIAFTADGRLFATGSDTVFELRADGTKQVLAAVPHPVGLAAWDGALFVASGDDGSGGTGSFCAETRRGGIYKVMPDGTATLFASGIRAPNFAAVTPWDTLLVSDDCATNTQLYEVSKSGAVTTFLDAVPSANGLAFDRAGTTLFTVSTFTDPAPFWRISVAEGAAVSHAKQHDFAAGTSPDGLAVSASGKVYVALNTGSRIERWSEAGGMEPFATGLETPASLAFGAGEGFDPCSLYVTSLFGDTVWRVRAGEGGLALRE